MAERRVHPDFPDYAVDSDGRVFRTTPVEGKPPPGELMGTVQKDKYKVFWLRDASGKPRWVRINRLVAILFISPPPSQRHVVKCKDGNRLNSSADNLYWHAGSKPRVRKSNISDESRERRNRIGRQKYALERTGKNTRDTRWAHVERLQPRVVAADELVKERDYRLSLPDRSLTATLLGDPKPGYSALEKRLVVNA